MSSFPIGISRVPTFLSSQISLANLNRTNLGLFQTTQQLSTGVRIGRPSDGAIDAATISSLDSQLERSAQRLRNLDVASSSLATLDNALGEAIDLINQAKSIASSQISTGTTDSERESQAIIIDSILDSMLRISNRDSQVGYIFGGTAPGRQPIMSRDGTFRFNGQTGGLLTDIGLGANVPITLGASNAIGALSGRIEGAVNLAPQLTESTRLEDLNGARGLGINGEAVTFSFDTGPQVTVDLSEADTIGDVIDTLTLAIRDYETENGVTVLGAGGLTIAGNAINFDVPAGELMFEDATGTTTGQDLGLVVLPSTPFDAARSSGTDLRPRVTWTTDVSVLGGVTGPLGEVRISNGGRSAVIDLSTAESVGDIRNLIEAADLGVRIQINEDGERLNILSEVAGSQSQALSIEEVDGNNSTAERLGIRSMMTSTPLSVFNDGSGVSIVSGATNADTGTIDPTLNTDFVITLGDGFELSIDLSPTDIDTVGSLITAINAQADAQLTAAGRPTSDFTAGLTDTVNGITFEQDAGLGGAVGVSSRNNSLAAEQLGLLDGEWDSANARFVAEDRATVRVNNLFTDLIDLRDALRSDDTLGIQFATDTMQVNLDRLIDTRALVGGYGQRVEFEQAREEERRVVDESVRSSVRDVDFAVAATRLAQLQTQLQAGLTATSQSTQLSLLDFLG